MSIWNELKGRLTIRPTPAPQSLPTPPAAPPRQLGLVLGGGGGKGGAHLGVLAVLEELGIQIDLIVGTSAGGAVGVLYAAGLNRSQIAEVFRSCALRRVALTDPSRMGLFGEQKRRTVLTRVLGDRTFEQLAIPCAVVAVDLISGQEVAINQGPLVPALLATTALPGVFPPVARGEQLLADGGILNNVPVDVALGLGAQRTIAVDLNGAALDFHLPLDLPSNPFVRLMLAPRQFAIASRALTLLMQDAARRRLAQYPPDLLIQPNVISISTLDMARPEAGYTIGITAARAAAAELLALRDWRVNSGGPSLNFAEPASASY